MQAQMVTYRGLLMCPGPDGEPECGEVLEFEVADAGPVRTYRVPQDPVCPKCGRTDGFSVRIGERVS